VIGNDKTATARLVLPALRSLPKDEEVSLEHSNEKPESMRVLIVDDEPLARTALVNILAERNDIDVADNWHRGCERITAPRSVQQCADLLLQVAQP